MTDEMILKKAIKKAVKGGYTNLTYELYGEDWIEDTGYLSDGRLFGLIFSHDFVKAFWGEDTFEHGSSVFKGHWLYHLQNMVIEKNPLKYLEKFLDKEE